MKHLIILLVASLTVATAKAQIDSLSVLFLGNSYTACNNLPRLFQELTASGGKFARVDANPPGGYWLEDHCQDSISLCKIAQGGWDYVILQEQSQVPTIGYYRVNSMLPSAVYLDSLIQNVGGNTALYMTWGRENGGQQSIGGYFSYPFASYFEMQDTVTWAYNWLGNQLGATICPVGVAWEQAVILNSTIDLWAEDGGHPTLLGSYLGACVFFEILYQESPVGLTYTAGINPDTALFLQNSAHMILHSEPYSAVMPVTRRPRISSYPNPFNASVALRFELSDASPYDLVIYDIRGREVWKLASCNLQLGTNEVVWNAEGLPSGIYFVKLSVIDGQSSVQKLLFIK